MGAVGFQFRELHQENQLGPGLASCTTRCDYHTMVVTSRGPPMSQAFKTVYFPDHPADSTRRRNVKIAFGVRDRGLYDTVKPMSSQEIRGMLGIDSYKQLQQIADESEASLNALCIRRLKQAQDAAPSRDELLPGLGIADDRIDPIQTTFRGGATAPFQRWYPYLEGYSPDFVHEIVNRYASRAKHIHDPFAGSGTTPLTVARLGLSASYCELNPLLHMLIEAKASAHRLSARRRTQVLGRLSEYVDELDRHLCESSPSGDLEKTRKAAFGSSVFFDDEVLDDVLRLRTVIDGLANADPVAAMFLSVAAVSSLVPVSRLIRRGDLRFRKGKELDRPQPSLVSEICRSLRQIIEDIETAGALTNAPALLAADAKTLDVLPRQSFDAVITSPPYLNGTNYFRNTKIELWFLRCLNTRADLAGFRSRAITAGINDVSKGVGSAPMSPAIADVVAQVESCAYDQRIPRMVAAYFDDMSAVARGLRKHCANGCPVLLDIGDSAYAGVRVDTPRLLASVFEAHGFRQDEEIVLRRRMSRSGLELRQVLLRMTAARSSRRTQSARVRTPWRSRWTAFKRTLPHQDQPFCKRNWGNPLHSVCSYQGKMKPSLAHHLVETFVPRGGSVLDPFAGVGTIPFEGALGGRRSIAFDLSPAAVAICAAKIERSSPEDCTAVIADLEAYLATSKITAGLLGAVQAFGFNGKLEEYFHPKTLEEVVLARSYFAHLAPTTPGRHLVLACLLHILHGNRPYALSRRSHPITPFKPTGEVEYRGLVDRLRTKVDRCFATALPDHFAPGETFFQDATAAWPSEVDALDAIITSPPFFDSTRFYLANWMRLWFCGWEPNDFKERPQGFVDERQKSDFGVYSPIFRQARERLKAGAPFVLHLGRSSKCDMATVLSETASPWFKTADIFFESVEHCESHGIRDKGTVRDHGYLVLT